EAALAVVLLCGGCLDSMVGDQPGYSRYILPPGSSMPPFATDDVTTFRKIDVNDGVAKPGIMPKVGWAAGEQVMYWDFGAGKLRSTPAYVIASCNGTDPTPTGHPVIVDSIPGDSDYSPYRALLFACITDKYKGEVLPSVDAFNDAIDLGLITDPTGGNATYWVDHPITTGIEVPLIGGVNDQRRLAFYRGTSVWYETMEPQEGPNPFDGVMPVVTNNVYEIVKPNTTAVLKVIFAQPLRGPDGTRNLKYTPAWLQVTVTLEVPKDVAPPGDAAALSAAYDAALAKLTKESDLVTVGMNNALTVVDTKLVRSAVATTNRVNRPFVAAPGAP
ncbi:MAG TPA: hypothetical protein VFX59_11645, partial [Polyangiales bacterium]|nr:hypothetical protein [Polyangiales bacterium]